LVALIKTLTPCETDAFVTLKDPFGDIPGTVHSKVLEGYSEDFGMGAVLVMQKVSVFNPSPRSHYLNITPDNIVRVFPANSPMPIDYKQKLQNRDLNHLSNTQTTSISNSLPLQLSSNNLTTLSSSERTISSQGKKDSPLKGHHPVISIGKTPRDTTLLNSDSLSVFNEFKSRSSTSELSGPKQISEPMEKKTKLIESNISHSSSLEVPSSSQSISPSTRNELLEVQADPILNGMTDVDQLLEGLDASFWDVDKI